MSKRSFRIVAIADDDGINFENGVYYGRGPAQAAAKAFNWYCRKTGLAACTRKFTMEEMTRGKPRKQFHYVGSRQKLAVPKEIERNGTPYSIHYETTIRKAK